MIARRATPLFGLAACVAFLLLKGCDGEPKAPPADPPGEPVVWREAPHPYDARLKFSVPEAWTKDYERFGPNDDTVMLHGPEEDGFKPNVQVGWIKSVETLDQWAGRKIDSLRMASDVEVFGQGVLRVAGMRGKFLVYGRVDRTIGQVRHFDVYFVGHGRKGFVRGTAPVKTFLVKYRALFQAIAMRLRWDP